jgi:predicted GH43/DUF377 family glycosyl hydrolase
MYRARTGVTPVLDGVNLKKRRFIEPEKNKFWSSFNPSISKNPDGRLATTIRSSNYLLGEYQTYTSLTIEQDIRNRVFFADVNEKLDLENFREVKFLGDYPRGVEDCRLLWRDDSWHFLGVILEKEHTPVARQGLFRYDEKKNVAELVKKFEGPSPKRVEKNWGALAIGESSEFDFIYSTEAIYKDGKVKSASKPNKKLSYLRGGSQLIEWEDGYLSLVHITKKTPESVLNNRTFSFQTVHFRDYTHLFAKYDLQGNLVALSPEFIFDIGWVEFASGLVQVGNELVVSYGVDDASMSFCVIDVDVVRRMLRKV